MNYLKDLEKIVKINSFTYNKSGVDSVNKIFSQWMKEIGFDSKIFKRELIGDHILFKSPKIDGEKILLLGHSDTVFPKDKFEEFREDEDWVYGAGVCDMKGGNIVALQSLRNIYYKSKQIRNIDFLLVSDEESGSDDSKKITSNISQNYDYCFVFEAAGKNLEVVTARKGIGTFFIDIKGKAAHAGTNYINGVDANLEASYKIKKLVKLTNLKRGTTLNVGKIEGGIGANTVSPEAKLTFELRYETISERDRVLKSIDKIVNKNYVNGIKSTLTGSIQRDVMEYKTKHKKLISKLEKITNSTISHEKRGGVSDANITSTSKLLTIDGFGPYGDGDHTTSERALKSSFESRISLMTKIFQYHQKNLKI